MNVLCILASKHSRKRAGNTMHFIHFFHFYSFTRRVAGVVAHFLNIMKKALRETQTLRAGCSKAEPKIFALPQTPFPGADGMAKI